MKAGKRARRGIIPRRTQQPVSSALAPETKRINPSPAGCRPGSGDGSRACDLHRDPAFKRPSSTRMKTFPRPLTAAMEAADRRTHP